MRLPTIATILLLSCSFANANSPITGTYNNDTGEIIISGNAKTWQITGAIGSIVNHPQNLPSQPWNPTNILWWTNNLIVEDIDSQDIIFHNNTSLGNVALPGLGEHSFLVETWNYCEQPNTNCYNQEFLGVVYSEVPEPNSILLSLVGLLGVLACLRIPL